METGVLKIAALAAGGLAVAGLLMGRLAFLGVLAGFIMCAVYFKALVLSHKILLAHEGGSFLKIKRLTGRLLRFFLLALFFWMAASKDLMFFMGAAAGFLSLKIALIALGLKREVICGT